MGTLDDIGDGFTQRLERLAHTLGPAGLRVARYIGQNRAAALASSAMELAALTATSDATVVRTVQALGYTGIAAMKQALVAAIDADSTPADDMRHTLADLGEDAARAIDMVLQAHDAALDSLRTPEFHVAMAGAVAALHPAERIVVFGIGPSAALAGYAATLLGRAGRRSRSLDASGTMLADQLLDLRRGDAVLALAYGRAYREVTAVFGEARRLGLPVVLVCEDGQSDLARQADRVLAIPRGRRQRVALHGATLVGLEALVLGLTASNAAAAVASLDRLNELRRLVGGPRSDVG